MNWYETKQAARKERQAQRAERLENESNAAFDKARRATEHIPFGQPILVGHHSEKRHRAGLTRQDHNMRKGIELSKQATEAARRASTQSSAISSDDPDAIAKLKEKLARLEQSQATMKTANKLLRKGDIIGLAGLVGEDKAEALQQPDFAGRTGYPGYMLTNNNANIRSTKQRIAELEARGDMEQAEDRQGDGYVIREDVADNRLLFLFDDKPPAETRTLLKSNGFRWSPSRMAWVRKLNGNARYAAECVAPRLGQERTER